METIQLATCGSVANRTSCCAHRQVAFCLDGEGVASFVNFRCLTRCCVQEREQALAPRCCTVGEDGALGCSGHAQDAAEENLGHDVFFVTKQVRVRVHLSTSQSRCKEGHKDDRATPYLRLHPFRRS